jgi:hypothetical protein
VADDFIPGYDGSLAVVPRPLTESPEEAALCYFFSHFTFVPRHSQASRGYLDYLLPLYASSSMDSSLASATAAISLATFGNNPCRNYLMHSAHEKYNDALVKVNRALRDPVKAKQDETLMTILLFSLFEVSQDMTLIYASRLNRCDTQESVMPLRLLHLTFDQSITATPESLPKWGLHTDGAIALIKMRGKEQLNNPQSLKLFLRVRAQMIISHIQRSKPLDEFYDAWAELPGKESDTAGNRLTALQVNIPNLRAKANELLARPRNDETVKEVIKLMEDSLGADKKLSEWPNCLPPSWRFESAATMDGDPGNVDDAEIWPGNMDVYYDVWVASVWNSYRASRIYTQTIVVRCIQWLCPSGEFKQLPVFKTATAVLQEMVDDICAAVPYHMGYIFPKEQDLRESIYPPPSNVPFVRPNHEESVKVLGSYFLLWPLFTASSVVTIPMDQRKWLKSRLTYIARRFGISRDPLLARTSSSTAFGRPAFI